MLINLIYYCLKATKHRVSVGEACWFNLLRLLLNVG